MRLTSITQIRPIMFTKFLRHIVASLAAIIFFVSCTKSSDSSSSTTDTTPKVSAIFNLNALDYYAPSEIIFTNYSTNAVSYLWDFGDNTTSTLTEPRHVYNSSGSYTVTLTATGSNGSTSTAIKTVTITQGTALRISVKDELGNLSVGATVKLYSNLTDYTNKTNQVGATLTTNSSGYVLFKNLNPLAYYFDIANGCQNNIKEIVGFSSPIPQSAQTNISVTLTKKGAINISNDLTYSFDIYLDNVFQTTLKAYEVYKIYNLKEGNYTVKCNDKRLPPFNTNSQTFSTSVSCGMLTLLSIK